MAGLAGAIDLQDGTIDLVVGDLHRALTDVGHVAVGAGYARTRVHALVPHLEFRMTRLGHGRSVFGVLPFLDVVFVKIGDDVFYFQALAPGEGKTFLRALEEICNVALTADEGSHLLP